MMKTFQRGDIGKINKILSEIHGFRNMAKLALDNRKIDDFDSEMSNIAIALDRIAKIRNK